MKIFTLNSLKNNLFLLGIFCFGSVFAQEETTKKDKKDDELELNMDAVFNRPTLSFDKVPVTVGGYLEANTMHRIEEVITDGLSFQARRLTIFMAASISERIKFLTEIEFEDGGKEVAIEFAALDVAFHPLFSFRGGIVMNPIGAFNENHDGPKWEFVERPDVAVNMLAATLSNTGFGMYGKTYSGSWIFGYEAYLTNGFSSRIISNEEDKTYLPAHKEGDNLFEENFSGKAMFSGKLAIKNRKIGEIGISYMGGTYNKFEDDGEEVEDQAQLDVFAIDWNTTIKATGTYIVGKPLGSGRKHQIPTPSNTEISNAEFLWISYNRFIITKFSNGKMQHSMMLQDLIMWTGMLDASKKQIQKLAIISLRSLLE